MKKQIIDYALDTATNAHKGQKRWDGSPYIEHPKAVMELVDKIFKESKDSSLHEITLVCALYHDIAEDTNIDETMLIRDLEDKGFIPHSTYLKIFSDSLRLLNKNNHNSYLDFILACKEDLIAKRVKIADITHNLSDLKKGSMRDKYILALHILNN